MGAIIPLFLANLPALISAGESLAGYIGGMHTALSQSDEWTADHQAQFDAMLNNAANLPESKTDAQAGQ